MDLRELEERANKLNATRLKRYKERYALALSLGFTPSQAVILRYRTEEEIVRLASEKEKEDKKRGEAV